MRGEALERPVLTSLKATHAGERLDRFELVAEIASGGMATVYLARLEGVAGFQRLFAIKRLHPHLANEGEFVDMFLDEARLAARIHHPNVVPILEVGTSAEGYYLVMEYIEGDTAARLLARASQGTGQLPPPIASRIALDTLNGLHAAHELTDDEGHPLNIVHRDVSPQNILVGIDGTSRITDFGVAHAATRLSTTRSGQLKGKLAYMAPEQARGALVDRRADVFAMGVVLWEMLAGKRLFKAGNDAETLHRILFAPLPTVRGSGVDIPIPLEAVVMKALDRESETRYASAADFADELERVTRSLGMLGTTRDIASYIDTAIGAEISQQRDVVRMWLSRSEPSRNVRMGVPLVPEDLRGLRAASGGPAARISSRDVTQSEGQIVSSKGLEVSSVSSAVLEMPEATTTDSRVMFANADKLAFDGTKRRKRQLVLFGSGAGALMLVLLVLFAFSGSPRKRLAAADPPSSPRPPSAETPAPPVAAASPPASATPAQPPPAAIPAASVAAAPTPTTPPPARASTPVRPPRSGTGAAKPAQGSRSHSPAPGSDDVPDDLSRNPYR